MCSLWLQELLPLSGVFPAGYRDLLRVQQVGWGRGRRGVKLETLLWCVLGLGCLHSMGGGP